MNFAQLIINIYQQQKQAYSMESAIAERRNKQNLNKLNSFIEEYEVKLDQRVDQVISELLNYSKKVSDSVILPEIREKKSNNSLYSTSKKNTAKKNDRNKSLSGAFDMQTSIVENYQNTFQTLKSTFKPSNLQKVGKQVVPMGRAVGRQKITKPKFIKRQPQILPKQMRLNPFYQKNAIKSHELNQGLFNLIQKGKISKDVNVISAFQKGTPILQTQKAIFHHGEERFVQLDAQKSVQIKQKLPIKKQSAMKDEFNKNNAIFDENWAITMPKQEFQPIGAQKISAQKYIKEESVILQDFSDTIYIKILNYSVVRDEQFLKLKKKHLQFYGQIQQILNKIQQLSQRFAITILYIDSKKLMKLVTVAKKLTMDQLQSCIVKEKEKGPSKIFKIKSIATYEKKRIQAIQAIKSSFISYYYYKKFLKYLKTKRIYNNIYSWAYNSLIVKKHKQNLKRKLIQNQEKFALLQQNFKKQHKQIINSKHFEIHLVNQCIGSKFTYSQILNTQLTRIFNIQNINTHLIYLIPSQLDSQTVNYYYKIMELEQIPNYRERVTFMEVDPKGYFSPQLKLSSRLYFSSKDLRKLKKKVRGCPAYFSISYPSKVDVELAVFLGIPILCGNLIEILKMEKRANIQTIYKLPHIPYRAISPSKSNLLALQDQIRSFCQSFKREYQFIIKINGKYQSSGLALLSFPFTSFPEMYSNTTLVIASNLTVDEYYHELMKHGGIIQLYQQNLSPVTVVGKITDEGAQIIGTFDKISTGFINIGSLFPQKSVSHKNLMDQVDQVMTELIQNGHFGYVEISFFVDDQKNIFLEKVQCYFTNIGSSLFYFKFLAEGYLNQNGEFMAKIIDTYEVQNNKEEEVINLEPRCFCYIPYLLHFGLSERQASSFFQLCRMGGVSFDLQNKFGATFILLGSLKSSVGIISTSKQRVTNVKIMIKSLDFIIKQNSHNISQQMLKQKQIRMKERENILNVKARLEQFL